MATCLARNVFSTACRGIIAQSKASVQVRTFGFSRCVTANRVYTEKHEWVLVEGTKGTVGISNYAQENLGDIVFVDLPEVGIILETGDVAGCVESVKAASDLYAPVGGEVIETNPDLGDNPGLVNKSPLADGWLYKLTLADGTDTSSLMDEAAYEKFLEKSE